MYSQSDEESVIVNFFHGHVGRLLDIGAMDGKTNSNSLRLIELGWSAVLVEPSPAPLAALLELHADNPRVAAVNAAIAKESDFALWYDSRGDGLSTLVPEHAEKWSKPCGPHQGTNFVEMLVHTITLEQLLESVGFNFDFLSIDVEGWNWSLFNELPISKLAQLRMVCVEHDGHADDMEQLLVRFGFRRVHLTGTNCILARTEERR